jgi:uncharacterized membrane protein
MNQHKVRLAVAGMLGAGALLAAAGSAQAATQYQLTLGNSPVIPNANQTAPLNAVNNLGTPVGSAFFQGVGGMQPTLGLNYQRLSVPGDATGDRHLGSAFDINDSGTVVGYSRRTDLMTPTGFDVERPFAWDNGAVGDELAILPGISVEPHGINNAGDIVGFSFPGNGLAGATPKTTGFLLRPTGTLTALPPLPGGKSSTAAAINESGLVVGHADAGDNTGFATAWRNGVASNLGVLPDAMFSGAFDVNTNGAAVGFSSGIRGNRAVLFANGTVSDLNFPTFNLGRDVTAHAINDAGTIVGTGDLFTGTVVQSRAVRYQWGQAVDLNTLIAPGSGFTLRTALDVNDAGQIVGTATPNAHPDQKLSYILTPTG